jgi:hypothetical protein
MCLLWVMAGLVLLLLFSRREGMATAPEINMPNLATSNSPMDEATVGPAPMVSKGRRSSEPSYVDAENCDACTGAKHFWNKLTKKCSTTEVDGFYASCN